MEEGVEWTSIKFIYDIYTYIYMALYVTLVNVGKLLTNVTNVTKSSILDVAGVLDIPILMCKHIC